MPVWTFYLSRDCSNHHRCALFCKRPSPLKRHVVSRLLWFHKSSRHQRTSCDESAHVSADPQAKPLDRNAVTFSLAAQAFTRRGKYFRCIVLFLHCIICAFTSQMRKQTGSEADFHFVLMILICNLQWQRLSWIMGKKKSALTYLSWYFIHTFLDKAIASINAVLTSDIHL